MQLYFLSSCTFIGALHQSSCREHLCPGESQSVLLVGGPALVRLPWPDAFGTCALGPAAVPVDWDFGVSGVWNLRTQ